MHMNINTHAPVQSTRELHIEASAETVWGLLTNVDNWSRWNPRITRARLDGVFAPGAVFHWISRASSIVSTIQDVNKPHRVSWTGKTFGGRAVHVWTLVPDATGVQVKISESFDGGIVWLLRWWFRRLFANVLDEMLLALKTEAEEKHYFSSTVLT
jgi:uncharacterized protein YndB with AHSA1/START domain